MNTLCRIKAEDLRSMNGTELITVCDDIRKYLLTVINQTGGHLASNLATVETIVGMHYVFDYQSNNYIFDTGHQAYVHKMLTSRRHSLKTLGQDKG